MFSAAHPPAAIVFDNDGMLLDTEESWSRAETRLFERYGRSFTLEHKQQIMGSSGKVAGALLARWLDQPGRDRQLMDEVVELVHDEIAHGVELRHGARELLDALAASGAKVGLASNSSRRFIDEVLELSGIADLLTVTVAAHEAGESKPAPDVYLRAAQLLEAEPVRCVAFEDSLPGIAAAKAAGMFVVGVPSVAGMDISPPADVQLPSLADERAWRACGLGVPGQ